LDVNQPIVTGKVASSYSLIRDPQKIRRLAAPSTWAQEVAHVKDPWPTGNGPQVDLGIEWDPVVRLARVAEVALSPVPSPDGSTSPPAPAATGASQPEIDAALDELLGVIMAAKVEGHRTNSRTTNGGAWLLDDLYEPDRRLDHPGGTR